jgi:hypothetical protein
VAVLSFCNAGWARSLSSTQPINFEIMNFNYFFIIRGNSLQIASKLVEFYIIELIEFCISC